MIYSVHAVYNKTRYIPYEMSPRRAFKGGDKRHFPILSCKACRSFGYGVLRFKEEGKPSNISSCLSP
ncbi:unnamed protein product [Parnassius apollo]|uniref:(apollo) hypothetical protein n=1 Tax=Parnassius apollo TaxID=110799 RepID=A0A8S3WWH4_PARAO|nr:unnamed protein product [Parnassius apollo]